MSGFRLKQGGRIDRARQIGFSFNGRQMTGHPGDSLASALMANGVGPIGRSFKYHRPRGLFAAGVDDPNSMLAIRDGYGYDPALRAGQVALTQGLFADSVTGWPSPRLDAVSALTRLTAPFMVAGFYYKTLKWPNWSWYEEAIRKTAGFGKPNGEKDSRRRQYRHDVCDVVVVGAGPAGLAAVSALRGSGRRVVLVDDAPQPGGALLWEDAEIDGQSGADWARGVVAALQEDGGIYLKDTFVTGAYEGNFFTLVEKLQDDRGVAGERIWKLRAGDVVLATGAVDRPLVYQNNDRPGTMLASSVRRFIGQYGVAPGRELTIFANNDSGYLTALSAISAGLKVHLVDSRARPAEAHLEAAIRAGATVHLGGQIADVSGSQGVKAVSIAVQGRTIKVAADAVAITGGQTPLVHLAAHRGSKAIYDASTSSFVCPDLPPAWRGAGAVTGNRDLADVLAEGHAAGDAICARGNAAPSCVTRFGMGTITPLWQATVGNPKKMWVDLQNDVKASDVALAARENYTSVEHLKRYTTLGMGTDQGRTSNINGLAILAAQTGREMNAIGTTTFRPPYTATRMGAIAHHRQKDGFAPRRLMPAHADHKAHGAHFDDFGWERPDWFGTNGADREAAVAAEMHAVRNAVGVFDASPLGKIEICGPDARDFINRFYVSNLATLKPGKIRYSVMCRDDGIIFDDGVVACIDENYFLAGPTSGHAEAVGAWFERWRQTEWPNLSVSVTQVTSNWAAIALAGPKARDLLARLSPDFDIAGEAFPHMEFRAGKIAGVPARVARVSFTGELQYEVSVPARFGKALMKLAMAEGASLGARRVGMEAWLRLRLEKGYIHLGADTNGRTTPSDIGMGGLAAKKKTDFIGKRALSLPFNQSADREELVGLRLISGTIEIGGRIMAPGATQVPCKSIGNVTSACNSPMAGNIGMALIEGGSRRMEEKVNIFASGKISQAEICSPVFVDVKNERLHA